MYSSRSTLKNLSSSVIVGLTTLFAVDVTVIAQEAPKERFIHDLMLKMTTSEKVGQLRLIGIGGENTRERVIEDIQQGRIGAIFNTISRQDTRRLQTPAVEQSRLGIPLLFAYDVVHGHRTIFPVNLGLAASWNPTLLHRVARVSAVEAAADGLDLTFAPMVDLSREPRWGRVSEGFGEDAYLSSTYARSMVQGFQNSDLTRTDSVMACVKHFAAYGGVEGGRDYNLVDMSTQRLFNDYLPPYKAAIDAGAGCVMGALNSLNGVPATADTWLTQTLLRKEWGFKGLLITDHGAINELVRHGVARDDSHAAQLAIAAGYSLSMSDGPYGQYLEALVQNKAVPIKQIDQAVYHVLSAKYDLGLFDDPYRRIGQANDDPPDFRDDSRLHRQDARQVAHETLVLLKNEHQTLPLNRGQRIALIGPLADSKRDIMGSWSAAGLAKQAISLKEGLIEVAGEGGQISYALGANLTDDERIYRFLNSYELEVTRDPRSEQELLEEARLVAQQADVIVLALGESQGMAHEASSKTDLNLPATQQRLLNSLKDLGKPIVLVLFNGRPLTIEREVELSDAVLETWFAGTEGGHAIADVLFGDVNPSGKLAMTFPRSVGQIPIYYNTSRIGRPANPADEGKYASRYFDIYNTPLFPFGYGLSYTDFELSDILLSTQTLTLQGSVRVSVKVKNTGQREGATVVQLYTAHDTALISRPVKQLTRFEKVWLEPHQEQLIEFVIDARDLAYYNNLGRLEFNPGKIKVFVGLDSEQVQLSEFEFVTSSK